METAVVWYLVLGFVLVLVALSSSFFERVPVTTSILYFFFGILLGPYGFRLVEVDLIQNAGFFERLTEVVVIISLFVAGLKLRLPFRRAHWAPSLRLAFVSMTITVALIASTSHFLFAFPIGVAILLGAILSPTDPVLASHVQLRDPEDRDHLRFSLTGEAGLNDGTAFPFVMLGLGLLGLSELGPWGARWLALDVFWSVTAGLASGWALGWMVSQLVLVLRRRNEETLILDDFLALGLIALSYGSAHVLHAYGFLAVFAAGLAMRKIESPKESESLKSSHMKSATVSKAVRSFTEQMERIGEVASVMLLGAMFQFEYFRNPDLILIPVIFLVIRPLSVILGLWGFAKGAQSKPWIAWFGIRGIGSLYYLTYALERGFAGEMAHRVVMITYCTVVTSIFVHGISGLPLMNIYQRITSQRPSREKTFG